MSEAIETYESIEVSGEDALIEAERQTISKLLEGGWNLIMIHRGQHEHESQLFVSSIQDAVATMVVECLSLRPKDDKDGVEREILTGVLYDTFFTTHPLIKECALRDVAYSYGTWNSLLFCLSQDVAQVTQETIAWLNTMDREKLAESPAGANFRRAAKLLDNPLMIKRQFKIESDVPLTSDWLPAGAFTCIYTDRSMAIATAIAGVEERVTKEVRVIDVSMGEVVWRSTDEEYD